MDTTLQAPPGQGVSEPVEVLVSDLTGQQRLRFPAMDPATPVGDLVDLSRTRMTLPPGVAYHLRDSATSRLLSPGQPVGDVARQGKFTAVMQPDARLG